MASTPESTTTTATVPTTAGLYVREGDEYVTTPDLSALHQAVEAEKDGSLKTLDAPIEYVHG